MTETAARKLFKALPGYPFDPCQICVSEGFGGMACDHTVLERAQAMHPGLVLHQLSTDANASPSDGFLRASLNPSPSSKGGA